MRIGMITDFHAVCIGQPKRCRHSGTLQIFTDGKNGQLCVVVDGALHDGAEILALIAIVHSDCNDVLSGIGFLQNGNIAHPCTRPAFKQRRIDA